MESFTLQVLCMILIVSIATFFLYKMTQRSWTGAQPPETHLPPSPPKLPIIGHLHLLTGMPHHTFAQLAQKLGPVIYLQLGRVPTLVISSARLAELVLKAHDHIFANRPQLVSAQYLSFGCSDVTFSPSGSYWRQARKICITELLSPKRVNSFKAVRNDEIQRMLQTVSTRCNSELNMSELFFSLANDILCMVAFGKRFIDKEANNNNKKKKMELVGVLTEAQALFAGFSPGDFFPDWDWVNSVSGMKRRLTKSRDDLKRVCDEIISEHVKKREDTNGNVSGKEDFVDVLLRVQAKKDLEMPITHDNLKALVLDMFVAGTDTSAATLEWTMTELARHQSIMNKAQDEVRKIAGTQGKVDEKDLQHLPYLKAVIKEAMRLHPPVPLLVPRESMEKCTLDGYEIPAKTRVLINTYAIGRDAESWENPLEYNPMRFIDMDIDFRGQDFRFLPFGGGRRGCPGYAFGLATVEITLARLLYHFDWQLPEAVEADEMDLGEIFGLATKKRSPLKLVPTINTQHAYKGAYPQQ